MTDHDWYLGPLGDMRPLVVPEPGIEIAEVRYGGVHQGLSGARTMDVTGNRSEYKLGIKHLEPDEFLWLEALHARLVPGPFYLINPLKRNRLTAQASRLLPVGPRSSGVYVDSPYTISRDWPDDVPVPGRSLALSGWEETVEVRFDPNRPVPLLSGDTLTASVYLKADVPYDATLRVAWYDEDKKFLSNTDIPITIANTWSRHWTTYHEAPREAAAAKLSVPLGTADTTVYVAAPQLEVNTSWPSTWEVGGGAPLVLFDQLPTVSGRYPLRDVVITLLEA